MTGNSDLVAGIVREFGDVAREVLARELQLSPERAGEIGLLIATAVCREFAGLNVYIPQGTAQQLEGRDAALYAEYERNGRNAAAIAKSHGLSIQTVYKRIRMIEARELAARQNHLFQES